jgi:hypothetical protein
VACRPGRAGLIVNSRGSFDLEQIRLPKKNADRPSGGTIRMKLKQGGAFRPLFHLIKPPFGVESLGSACQSFCQREVGPLSAV